MMDKKILLSALLAAASTTGLAATTSIGFDTDDYKSVSIYDSWVESPFRTGALNGNAAVVDNPDTSVNEAIGEAPNPSAKVLGAQRSRYGSNLFGVRVDLKEPFRLTTTGVYVHALIHRPVTGRVALVALGKRIDRDDQTGDEEQIQTTASNEVKSGRWSDAVFNLKGSPEVEIHSLVIVPECESPHNRTEDFLFYVDDIQLNSSSTPRYDSELYELNYDKASAQTRNDRYTTSVSIESPTYGLQTIMVNQDQTHKLYMLSEDVIRVKAGEEVTPTINYTGTYNNGYLYIDRNDNGQFEPMIGSDKHTILEGSELLCFSNLKNFDSKGTRLRSSNTMKMPAFTIPADLKAGVYRVRMIADWDSSDPAGSSKVISGGGSVTDLMLVVDDGSPITITASQLNGTILDANDKMLENNVSEFGAPYTIKMSPAPGFSYAGVKVRYGYKLDGTGYFHQNRQYRETIIEYQKFNADHTLTLPSELTSGNVSLEGLFVESSGIENVEVSDEPEAEAEYFNLNGVKVDAENLTSGCYICRRGTKATVIMVH